jgi:lipid-A-disaccharide synthase
MSEVRRPSIMIVAGEPSGDALGAQLIAALRTLGPRDLRLTGAGGPLMERQGLTSLFAMGDIAVMGLREVVPRLSTIFRRIRETAAFALKTKPDVLVLIDSGDFNHRVAKRVRAGDPSIRIVKYVSSQVWASRPGRAAGMKAYLDHILCLLPFEPDFYKPYGVPATFVGHPVIERAALIKGGSAMRRAIGVGKDGKLVCVLPGSRVSEVRIMLPLIRGAVARLAKRFPDLKCVLPVAPNVAALVRSMSADWPVPLTLVEGEAAKFQAFDAADLALAASGTVATELALAACPMVVFYRVGWLTAAIWKRLVKVPHITIANLVLGRRAIPEIVQDAVTPDAIAEAALPLLESRQIADGQRAALREAIALLGKGEAAPASRAARAILDFLPER